MKTFEMVLKGGFAVGGAWLAQLYGGCDAVLAVLLVLLAVDYASGVMRAAYNCELSSSAGFRGLLRKGGILLVVLVAARLDAVMGEGHAVRSMTCMFYVANEGLSILENVGKLGVPLPEALRKVLAQLRNQNDDEKDK